MKCFRHGDVYAVGTCRACNKGLCHDCAADLGHALACKDECEEKAELLQSIVKNNFAGLEAQRRNRYFMPAFFGFIGIASLIFGLNRGLDFNYAVAIGAGFLVFAFVLYLMILRWTRETD
jgi:hypothetical protein